MRERDIFIEALELGNPAERAALLDEACHADAPLRGRVEQLLAEHERQGSFILDRPLADLDATADHLYCEHAGTVIGPYKLLQQIGEGGMGVVFMATQTEPIQRTVAIKIIRPGMDTRQVIARFEAERQAVAMMDHPNIAKVLDAGTTETGRPYFVMELVKGVPITKYCDEKHLPLRARLELLLQVCEAVQHAHQKGLIHRDIKPTNVLVAEYDDHAVPKVIDFGVAKATASKLTEKTMFTELGQMVGTVEYMSPEQAKLNQLDIDTRSDIYSLGVLLYELLTGSTPFARKRLYEAAFDEMLRIIREEEPPKPSTRLSSMKRMPSIAANRGLEPLKLNRLVRGELDWIVMKALEKDRSRRYETASGLAADIQRYLDDEAVEACPPTAMYRFRKFARRNKAGLVMAVFVGSAILVTLIGLAASTLLIARQSRTTNKALQDVTLAKADLQDTLEHQRRDSYFRRIAMAHSELSVNNLGGALNLLRECPEDLRRWEWRYLMSLCRVEPLIIRDKTGLCSIAFSADGERLASGGGDGVVKVWNSRTGKVIKTIPAHIGFASSVAFHPDRNHLISVGADRLVKVWDLTTDPAHAVFERPCDAIHTFGTAYAAAFSPFDPDDFAVGCEGMVTIWNWKTQKPVHTLAAQGNSRISLAFSRDGRRLALGDWRGNVRLWNPETEGEPLFNLPETRYAVVALSFNKDGNRLATANFGRRVDVWDTTTGKPLRSLPQSGEGSGLVLGVAFSPDGQLIASTGEDKIVHVWDANSGRPLLDLHGHIGICGCVAFSPDGLRLASASMDGTIRMWDATPLRGDERQEMATFAEHPVEVWSVAVSPDAKKVASAGFGPPAMIWDLNTREVSSRFSDYNRVVFCLAWNRDSRRIAFAGGNEDQFTVKVKVWGAPSEQDDFALPAGPEYFAVAFSPDGLDLVTGNAKGLVQVWDANNGQPIRTLGTHKGMVRGIVFSPDRKRLASVSSDGEVRLWDATRLANKEKPQEPLRIFPAHSPGVCLNVAFSPDGKRLAAGGQEGTVKIWNVETGEVLPTLPGRNDDDVYTLAYSPNGRWIASAGVDSTVKIWDSHSSTLVRSFRGHTGLVSSLAFCLSPDDQRLRLISGSRDHTVKVWDVSQLDQSPENKTTSRESGVSVLGRVTSKVPMPTDP